MSGSLWELAEDHPLRVDKKQTVFFLTWLYVYVFFILKLGTVHDTLFLSSEKLLTIKKIEIV